MLSKSQWVCFGIYRRSCSNSIHRGSWFEVTLRFLGLLLHSLVLWLCWRTIFISNFISFSKNFAFKCHRIENDIYAVNSIAFHPTFGTFATAGSDGTIHFWDKDSKQKLKGFNRCPAPITATTFNRDGTIFAYSVSYDWSKGHEHHNPSSKNFIFLHATEESEVRPKKK